MAAATGVAFTLFGTLVTGAVEVGVVGFEGAAGAEATGKTITVNGNAAASTFSPGLVRNFTFGTQFDGVTKFDTQGYFVPPSGTTEQQFPNFAGVDAVSARGVFAGGYGSPYLTRVNNIDYITISSTGNSSDFGDLSTAK